MTSSGSDLVFGFQPQWRRNFLVNLALGCHDLKTASLDQDDLATLFAVLVDSDTIWKMSSSILIGEFHGT